MILRMDFRILGFYHLMTHAVFKSLLFLRAAIIIRLMKNNQAIRCCEGLRGIIPFATTVFYVSIFIYDKVLFLELNFILKFLNYRIFIHLRN